MIERYSYKPISSIWSYSGRLKRFVKIEAEAVRYYESTGEVPRGSADKIARAKISKNDVIEREKITKHDIIAFLEALEEASGVSKGLHMGLTSSDILDTATGMQIRDTAKVVRRLIKSIEKILLELIHKWKGVTIMGRTHNVHAEPTTLGLKFLNHLSEFDRCAANLLNALDQGSAGVISGAVGTYAVLTPEMERYVLKNLRLKRIIGTNQVIQRDIHARIASEAAILGGCLERITLNIRLLSHTELGEVMEGFTKGQKGSSAMPHKKNPIKCERVSGMARLLRGYSTVAMENIMLMHERDISHSSAERIILPDIFHSLCFILTEVSNILGNIRVNEDNIKRNIELSGERFLSGSVLKELMKSGFSRKEGYEKVQELVFNAINKKVGLSKEILSDPGMKDLFTNAQLKAMVSQDYFTRFTDEIIKDYLEEKNAI